jgi:hypothetical protein
LHQVERFALGHIFRLRNIQQDDVSEFGCCTPVGASGTYVTGSDDTDFCSTHVGLPFEEFSA